MVVSNSIRQLMRTPVKTFMFFALLALAVAFFLLGYNLWFIAGNNARLIEKSFTTIGTVEQKPISVVRGPSTFEETRYGVIGYSDDYTMYGETIPASVLDFEGAGYIIKPEQRPVYIASHPDYVVSSNHYDEIYFDLQHPIIEFEPLEDGITTNPIPVKVKKVLYGELDDDEIILEHYMYDMSWELYKGKTYIACLQPGPKVEGYDEFGYIPIPVTPSHQYTKEGEHIPNAVPVIGPWDEVTENFYETPGGKRWLAVMEGFDRIKHAIPVVPVNGTKLLLPFHSGDATIVQGRDITAEEYAAGEKVCLVDRNFAANNRLTVGDELRLPLYYADYFYSSIFMFPKPIPEDLAYILINARGEGYPAFEDSVYRIVGIYSVPKPSSASGYELGHNAVIIPWKSVKNSDENNIFGMGPMMGYNTAFQIPNGHIPEFLSKWKALGINDLKIVFFDNGYSMIKEGLESMKNTAVILFSTGLAATLLVIVLFCHLFIGKQRKRSAIERSLGMNKRLCAVSLLAGLMLLVIAAYIFGSLAGYLLTDVFARQRPLDSHESFDMTFSNWRATADTNVKMSPSMEGIWRGALVSASAIPLTLLYALFSIAMNLRREPLLLLGEKNG